MPDYPKCNHLFGAFQCRTLTLRDVQNFHSSFYKRLETEYQNNVILRYEKIKNVHRRRSRKTKAKEKSKLLRITKYFVRNTRGEKVPVCMESFIAILGVSRYRVNNLTNDFKKSGGSLLE